MNFNHKGKHSDCKTFFDHNNLFLALPRLTVRQGVYSFVNSTIWNSSGAFLMETFRENTHMLRFRDMICKKGDVDICVLFLEKVSLMTPVRGTRAIRG